MMCVWAQPAAAQYFGRNKVPYKKLDFKVLRTEHFDIYHDSRSREGVEIAARMAERWRTRLGRQLGHELSGRQPLVLYASHPEFEQTNVIQGEIGESTGGVTEALRRRIVLPLAGPLTDTDHVLGHEIVHAFQYDITTRPGAGPGETGANYLPLWFIEGMAEYLTIGPIDPHTAMWLRDAVRGDRLPTVRDLDNPRYFPYRWGHAFWAYVGGTWGDQVIAQMLVTSGQTGDARVAIKRVLDISDEELSAGWHAAIRRLYAPVLEAATPPASAGTVLLKGGALGGDLNIGPAISPDGRLIAFLSERGLFSIDLFVADAGTGKILRKLTSTASQPHFASLQFIHSAGGWDRESRRLALATVVAGRATLAIFDVETGQRVQEIRLSEVDEIFNPTFSPDGRSVALTGMKAGLTDLYIVDLQTSGLRPLMSDPFADLQPAWSPDGRYIAFATDRFTSNLETLSFGAYRLGIVDTTTGRTEAVNALPEGKHINPQWAPDSQAIFFISDHDGVSNLYRATLEGDVRQITSVATGLSGITAVSPAMSIASGTGVAAFTVYDGGNYHVHTLDVRDLGAAPAAVTSPKALPPSDRRPSEVAAAITDPTTGLPPPEPYMVSDYKSRLSLEAVGQPTIAFGADRFGAAVGGGLSFYFSDLLGNQSLVTAVQLSQGIGGNFSMSNTAAQAAYINRSRRWTWGAIGGQIPYISGGFQSSLGTVSGTPALIDQTILFRQTDRSVSGLTAYPFSRAQRIELQAGVSQITFDQVVQTQAYSLATGRLILDQTETTSLGQSLSLTTSSAALVYDTSAFGATSPVAGQRYRFEAAPNFGTITYTGLLADYRRYFMPATLYTFATRVMHYGRYGSGGEDERLFPLFIGYPSLVRGYDVNTFSPSECIATATSTCPALSRLVGSRLLVANLEFRFPLLRPFSSSRSVYGPVPIEVGLFADGGVAWNRGQSPSFLGGDRRGVSSVGFTFRANMLGFAVGEFAFSRPLQREQRGWVFQFNLAPGF
jgi:hypothetical protein